MAKSRKEKEKIIEELNENLSNFKTVILTGYRGLKMDSLEELRNIVFDKKMIFKIIKNNLLKISLENNKISLDMNLFKDKPLALVFGQDEIETAKTVYEFSKNNEQLEILGGILDKQLLDSETIKRYALLPSREELYAKLVGSISSPLSGLINTLSGNLRSLINVLNGYKEKLT